MSRRIYITCHTVDDAYTNAAKQLKTDLQRFGIPLLCYPYTSKGNWFKNTHYKVTAISRTFAETTCDEVVCLDADCRVRENPNPEFDKIQKDLAVYYQQSVDGKVVMSGGTYFLRRTPWITEVLLPEWVKRCEATLNRPEDTILENFCPIDKVEQLPLTLCNFKNSSDSIIAHARLSQNRGTWPKIKAPVRYLPDGTIVLLRSNSDTEKWLDENYVRIAPNRWAAKGKNYLTYFTDYCKDKIVNIIGKGPSLDKITTEELGHDTIQFCLNDSVHAIERLKAENVFCILQDCGVLRGKIPQYANIFCPTRCAFNFVNSYNYAESELDLKPESLSAIVAIAIAKRLGAKKLRFLAFDAANGNVDYAKSVGYSPALVGKPIRFLEHWQRILRFVEVQSIEYEIVRLPIHL